MWKVKFTVVEFDSHQQVWNVNGTNEWRKKDYLAKEHGKQGQWSSQIVAFNTRDATRHRIPSMWLVNLCTWLVTTIGNPVYKYFKNRSKSSATSIFRFHQLRRFQLWQDYVTWIRWFKISWGRRTAAIKVCFSLKLIPSLTSLP